MRLGASPRTRTPSIRQVVLALVLGCFAPGVARADDDTAVAQQAALEAQRALEQHHYQAAVEQFRRAELLSHSPVHALGLARSLAGLNRVVSAEQLYTQIVRDGAGSGASAAEQKAVQDAKAELADVASRVAHVTITVTGPTMPYVLLDDVPLPVAALGGKQPIDPGEHAVRASARGFAPATTHFTVAEGGDAAAVLAMAQEAPETDGPPPARGPSAAVAPGSAPASGGPAEAAEPEGLSAYRVGAYASFGVGAVGLVIGIVEGLRASSIRSELSTTCAPNCSASEVDRVQNAITLSDVGYIVGATGLAAGLTLILLEPKPASRSGGTVAPYVAVGGCGLRGWF